MIFNNNWNWSHWKFARVFFNGQMMLSMVNHMFRWRAIMFFNWVMNVMFNGEMICMYMVFHHRSWSGRSIVMAWVMRLMMRFRRQMIFNNDWWQWRGSDWCHKFVFLMMMVRRWGSIMLFNMVMWWPIMFFWVVVNFMMYRMMINWMVRYFMVMNRVMGFLMWVMHRFHNNFIRSVIKYGLVRRRVMGWWMMRIWYGRHVVDNLVINMLSMDMVRHFWWAIVRFGMVMCHMVFNMMFYWRWAIVRLRFMMRMVRLWMMNFMVWIMIMVNGMMFRVVFYMRLMMVYRLKDNLFHMVFRVNNPGSKMF